MVLLLSVMQEVLTRALFLMTDVFRRDTEQRVKSCPYTYICGVYTIDFAGINSNIRSYTVYMYGSGQP